MRPGDVVRFSLGALRGHPVRTALILLAMAMGVGAVVVLTALGEGARRYVKNEFMSLGTHLLIVLPGRTETVGGPPPLIGETPRDLTLEDAMALLKSRAIARIAPIVVGSASVAWGRRNREVIVIGTTKDYIEIRRLKMGQGRFLPQADPHQALPVCVLGAKLKRELFGPRPALGQWARIGDRRFRVIGILASRGRSLGIDLDDIAIIPVASAQQLFNTPSLFRILAEAKGRILIAKAKADILGIIQRRHEGEEDVTVITQDAVLATFDRIFRALTLTVAGIAGISLGVAGILIMNVMLIAVSERRGEIGLLKALGAPSPLIALLFLSDGAVLALSGSSIGIALGEGGNWVLRQLYPILPIHAPWWIPPSALSIALIAGLAFSLLPAWRAARLDPVQALARR